MERSHKTVLDEFYRIAFRKRIYATIEQLQVDLDAWMNEYNQARPHQGRWCYGKTPMQTFLDTPCRSPRRRASGPRDDGQSPLVDTHHDESAACQIKSILLQMKNLAEFDFTVSPLNQGLVRELYEGSFLAIRRNAVLVGGTGTGKSHIAIRDRRQLRAQWRPRALLHRRRSGQSTRGRAARRQSRKLADQLLSASTSSSLTSWAICRSRSAAGADAVPPDQPALRAHLDRPVDQSRLCRMAVASSPTRR